MQNFEKRAFLKSVKLLFKKVQSTFLIANSYLYCMKNIILSLFRSNLSLCLSWTIAFININEEPWLNLLRQGMEFPISSDMYFQFQLSSTSLVTLCAFFFFFFFFSSSSSSNLMYVSVLNVALRFIKIFILRI